MYQNHHPPVGRKLASAAGAPVAIRPIDDCARFNLRVDPASLAAVAAVWGAELPARIGDFAGSPERLAACIGPDEWFLIAPGSERDRIEAGFAALYETTIHSLVDISHREVGILVEGAEAAAALQSAIAFPVGEMPVGGARRTLIDRVQIILIREAEDRFRIEVWPSFADHVWHLLAGICREFELGL
ncbi:sarcosine oxidase subunit gamma family protein [Aureimonas sp. ME7]|uniref:sarcosine oxidase subunit gamma n=1 Tax=Aureimonas sp. ME7 TaxID=2744252 RepID=UPI0015F6810D|nr:sarcosine oxidase subunit gamma family protein [Aureimonas sp. ME7]